MENFENNKIVWLNCMIILIIFIIVMFLHSYIVNNQLNDIYTTLIDIKNLLEEPCEIIISNN